MCIRDGDFSYIVPPLDGDEAVLISESRAVKTFILKNKCYKLKLYLVSTTA